MQQLSILQRFLRRRRQLNRDLSQDSMAESSAYLRDAVERQKHEGQLLAVRARWVAMIIIGIFIPFLNFSPSILYYEFFLLAFAGIGWLQLRAGKVGQSRQELVLIFLDLALLTFLIVVPNPFEPQPLPAAMGYKFDNFIYFFMFLAAGTLAYSWRTIIAFATWTSVLWIIGMIWVQSRPPGMESFTAAIYENIGDYTALLKLMDPNSINLGARIQEILVFALVAAVLALGVRRNTQLLARQADASRERANLARYFPPNIVDNIADSDEPLGHVRAQNVAVMFVDIVGFTRYAEKLEPEEVIAFLRNFHGELEAAVFQHGGTLDKFLGDGIMATFGTPQPGQQDAFNALVCAEDILHRIGAFNDANEAKGTPPVKIAIGLHFGPVILGDIGSKRRMEYAALGDVVNVASRLEALTRKNDVCVLASYDCVEEARKSNPHEADTLLSVYQDAGETQLRGRNDPIHVWARPS